MTCSQTVCTGSHIDQNQFSVEEDLRRKAKKYLTQFYEDHKRYLTHLNHHMPEIQNYFYQSTCLLQLNFRYYLQN